MANDKRTRRRADGARRLRARQRQAVVHPGRPVRTCGDCEACCYALGVTEEEFGKGAMVAPEFTHCQHQLGKATDGVCSGCAIYEDRPQSCRAFRCAWLDGFSFGSLPERFLRPDLFGAILWDMPNTKWGTLAAVSEAWPGSLERSSVRLLVEVLASQRLTILLWPGGRRILGPEQIMPQVREDLQAAQDAHLHSSH